MTVLSVLSNSRQRRARRSSTPAPAPARRRERNKEKKLESIVRAGRALFVQKGFDATTTRAITARAGVATGTFFLYFREKRDLLFHLFKDGYQLTGRFARLALAPVRLLALLPRAARAVIGSNNVDCCARV